MLFQKKDLRNASIILEFTSFLLYHECFQSFDTVTKCRILRFHANVLLDLKDEGGIKKALSTIQYVNKIEYSLAGVYLEIRIILAADLFIPHAFFNALWHLTEQANSNWEYIDNSFKLLIQRLEKSEILVETKDIIFQNLNNICTQYFNGSIHENEFLLIKVKFYILFDDHESLNQYLLETFSNVSISIYPDGVFEKIGQTLFNKGLKDVTTSNLTIAIEFFYLSKKVYCYIKNKQYEMASLRNICRCYIKLNNMSTALKYIEESLTLDRDSPRNWLMFMEVNCYLNDQDEVEKALTVFAEVLLKQTGQETQSFVLTLVEIIVKCGTCCNIFLIQLGHLLTAIPCEKVILDILIDILQVQLQSMSRESNIENQNVLVTLRDTTSFLEHVFANISTHITQNIYQKNLLTIIELILMISVYSRKFPTESIILIQYNIEICGKIILMNDEYNILYIKTLYIQTLMYNNLIDGNNQCQLSNIEICLNSAKKSRTLMMENYNLIKSDSTFNLYDAPLKCGLVELQCMASLVNIGHIDKSLINVVIEEVFYQNSELINSVDTILFIKFIESSVYILMSFKSLYNKECLLLLRTCLKISTEVKNTELVTRYKCLIMTCILQSGDVDHIINGVNELCQDSNHEINTYIGSQLWNNGISFFRQGHVEEARLLCIKGEEILKGLVTCAKIMDNMNEFKKVLLNERSKT